MAAELHRIRWIEYVNCGQSDGLAWQYSELVDPDWFDAQNGDIYRIGEDLF